MAAGCQNSNSKAVVVPDSESSRELTGHQAQTAEASYLPVVAAGWEVSLLHSQYLNSKAVVETVESKAVPDSDPSLELTGRQALVAAGWEVSLLHSQNSNSKAVVVPDSDSSRELTGCQFQTEEAS